MAEITTDNETGWSWANVVLTKSSRSSSQLKLPRNLSTCPDRSATGQVDRLVPKFKTWRAVGPDNIAGASNSRHAAAGPSNSGDEENCAAILQQRVPNRRAWAENCARLNPDHPPGDIPLRRWNQLIKDIGDFVDGGWAEKAATLGWTLGDLVGADPERPFARLDKAGLLWLLNSHRIIAICDNTATIETRTGARQTYHRKPNEPGRLLAWELVR
jgi:hypothetical protein